jgi:hypothetical protein
MGFIPFVRIERGFLEKEDLYQPKDSGSDANNGNCNACFPYMRPFDRCNPPQGKYSKSGSRKYNYGSYNADKYFHKRLILLGFNLCKYMKQWFIL